MNTSPTIAIVRRTSLLSDTEIARAVDAIHKQVNRDLLPAWGLGAKVIYTGACIPPAPCWPVLVVSDPPAPDADGWHTRSSKRPYGIVAVRPELDAGTAWTVCLSHEAIELRANPYAALSIMRDNGTAYDFELCDPCESDACAYKIGRTWVSDFIAARWYDQADDGPFSFAGNCSKPWQILPDGYMTVQRSGQPPRTLLHHGRPMPKSRIRPGSRLARRHKLCG